MKNYDPFRIKLGLTQSEMANYLQVSGSQLNMFEQGQRELPTQDLVNWLKWNCFR